MYKVTVYGIEEPYGASHGGTVSAITIFTDKEALKKALIKLAEDDSVIPMDHGDHYYIVNPIDPIDHIKWIDEDKEVVEDIDLDAFIDKGEIMLGDHGWMTIETISTNPEDINLV